MRTKTPVKTDAIAILKADHTLVKHLFEKFERSKDTKTKGEIARQAISALKVHATIEEELFYPQVRKEIDEDELMNEAEEEHHVAKILLEELENLDDGDPKFEAKFTVLAESVRHHIKEEEGEMLPEVKKTELDLDQLGSQMMERKSELEAAAGTKNAPGSR